MNGIIIKKNTTGCIIAPTDGSAHVFVSELDHTGYEEGWPIGQEVTFTLVEPPKAHPVAKTVTKAEPAGQTNRPETEFIPVSMLSPDQIMDEYMKLFDLQAVKTLTLEQQNRFKELSGI